jgi:hypothetical protein
VAAAANRGEQSVFTSKTDGSHQVADINSTHNELRPLVDHSVIDKALFARAFQSLVENQSSSSLPLGIRLGPPGSLRGGDLLARGLAHGARRP